MGRQICKECSKWTNTVTFHCEYCGAQLDPTWVIVLLFVIAVIGAATVEILEVAAFLRWLLG